MKTQEIGNLYEKFIIKILFDSLYKDNKISKSEYNNLLDGLKLVNA